MKSLQYFLMIVFISASLCACSRHSTELPNENSANSLAKPVAIAFMPDVHFHDIYGHFSNDSFGGLAIETMNGTQYATIRSMQAQLQSTRLFNENYFAVIAALDDIVKREIKYVALPGDFSDDGQPLHMRGLKSLLDKYHREYGIEFFVTNGNHDPTRPFTHAAGKQDYLGEGGQEQPIFSPDHLECSSTKITNTSNSDNKKIHPVICSYDVQELGYESIMTLLGQHGFYPDASYLYFETPYSDYTSKKYTFERASKQAQFDKRRYEICNQGAGGKYRQADYSDCAWIPDSSYLVEPVQGLWLLAIDANVYQPQKNSTGQGLRGDDFSGSGDAGYNKIISHKTHLLSWISDVVKRADTGHKTLIAFSHFPMEEFYDGASDDIEELFGKGKFQLNRRPSDLTSQILADTGLKVHVGGHMHMNGTGVFKSDSGKVLFNIQAPSLAAYAPAYKILTIRPQQKIEVETVVLKDVPRFKELFPLYQKEWDYLHSINDPNIWNKDILQSENYYAFTDWHLRELARLRFLPKEWPVEIRQLLSSRNGRYMLILSQLDGDINFSELSSLIEMNGASDKNISKKQLDSWLIATGRANSIATANNFNLNDFAQWNGNELSVDFYRLCNAGQLALKDINLDRLKQYQVLAKYLSEFKHDISLEKNYTELNISSVFKDRFSKILGVLMQFTQGEPNDHFILNIESGKIVDVSEK
jgi:hypothetical protein